MSSPFAVRVENLSKRYIIRHEAKVDTLRDALGHGARALWARLRQRRVEREEFWSLRDVSFEVQPGEVVGIIGRNGAGKSTLLKILSRITEPTTGKVHLRGRVASLLEVGTGFHPELSGRENIFLNGAILGMSRAEIRRKFDEIVAFAEVEKFLDTPVKRYSSGMYVRLAFAVAAHLEPEILIVDEVLAVGDAAFQKKCLGKMQSVVHSHGRTILFVSHNMAALRRLCNRGIVLQQGRCVHEGNIESALAFYEANGGVSRGATRFRQPHKEGSVTITSAVVRDAANSETSFVAGTPLQLEITLRSPTTLSGVTMGFTVSDRSGNAVFTSHHDDVTSGDLQLAEGTQSFAIAIDPNLLLPGIYTVTVGVMDRTWNVLALESECVDFEILPSPQQTAARVVNRPGSVLLPLRWRRL